MSNGAATGLLIVLGLWLAFAYGIGLASLSRDGAVVAGILGMLPLLLVAQYFKVRGRRRGRCARRSPASGGPPD